jgi:hypothetical protein
MVGMKNKRFSVKSGTLHKFTTPRTTIAGKDMPSWQSKQANAKCLKMLENQAFQGV